jgi:ribosomal protein L40E
LFNSDLPASKPPFFSVVLNINYLIYIKFLIKFILRYMQVFVRLPGGKHLQVELNRSDSVAELKSKIAQIEGIPSDVQRLVHATQELENNSSCENFEDGAYVDVEFELLGGIGPSDIPDHLKELAYKYRTYKMICRKCYARLPQGAHNCRKRKCGHCANIRPKKKIKEKEKGK